MQDITQNTITPMKKLLNHFCLPVAALAIGSPLAYSATLSGEFGTRTSNTPTAQNLTELGTVDWRIWDGTATNPAPLYNEKALGTAISNLSTTTGTGVGNSAFTLKQSYSYTNGTSPSAEASTAAGLNVGIQGTHANLIAANSGFSFTVTPASLLEHTVTIFGGSRYTGSTMTLALAGATTEIDTLAAPSNTFIYDFIYTAKFTPDSLTDLFTVTLKAGPSSQDAADPRNSIFFSAAAVSAVPEPSSLLLFAFGSLALLRRRR